jgi:choline transport protein
VGWLTSAGYFCWIAGTLLITSQLIIALICVCKTTFTTQPWHYYLTYMIIGIFTVMINVPLFKYYPSIYRSIAIYINIAALFLVITFLARTHPKQRAQFVFLDIVNSTGWDSNAVVFFLCLLPGVTAVNGFDSIAHMAEEMPDPRKQVPQIMILAAILSSITGFIMILVYMFCITNTENLTTPIGGQPIAQLMLDSFDSLALTIIGLLLIIICFIFACCSIMTTFSRVWWSLARDGGVPFSGTMSRVGRRSLVPANAVYFCFVSCALIGLLVFASTTALNAILAAGILFIFSSYLIPLTCLLIDRRRRLKEPHHFDFGSLWGTALNAISVVWICFVFVWVCFPVYIPVTGTTMNFAIVVFFIVLFISSINWFCYSAKHFTTPKPMGVSVALVMIC